jgi:hypothetical protein
MTKMIKGYRGAMRKRMTFLTQQLQERDRKVVVVKEMMKWM